MLSYSYHFFLRSALRRAVDLKKDIIKLIILLLPHLGVRSLLPVVNVVVNSRHSLRTIKNALLGAIVIRDEPTSQVSELKNAKAKPVVRSATVCFTRVAPSATSSRYEE